MATNNAINLGQTTFAAYPSTAQSNVTGDGTVYTVIFDTATVNEGSNYNTSTGIFTAPVAGNYLFNTTVELTGFTSVGTFAAISINSIPVCYVDSYNSIDSAGLGIILSGSIACALSKGATVAVTLQVSGGTKTVSVGGGSFFSGFQVL